MPKKNGYLSAAIATAETTKIQEELTEAFRKMSAKMTKSIFAGPPPASGSPHPFIGLRSILTPPKFGTVLRPKDGGTARLMVIGGNEVFPIKDEDGYSTPNEAQTLVSNWRDFWEPET